MASDETALTALTGAERALAEATTFSDFKQVRDMGEAAKAWAKARGMGIESENKAAEVIIRAERGMGQTLIEMREKGTLAKPGASPAQWTSRDATSVKTLEELGLGSGTDRNLVAKWQLLARIPEAEFNARFERVKAAGSRLAKVDFYRLVNPDIKRAKAAQKAIREEEHADDATPVFATWAEASEALLDYGLRLLPSDELGPTGEWLRQLLAAYNDARTARGG